MSAGIDWGLGTTNIDLETGIRYGVISIHEVTQAWADSSEAVYPQEDIDDAGLFDEVEPFAFKYEKEGYALSQDADGTDIFVLKSPYYTYAEFCSPCAPGAGYLMGHTPDGVKTYCLGADWFEDHQAPYPVYDVKTGAQVQEGASNGGD